MPKYGKYDKLSDLGPGDKFIYNDTDYIVIDMEPSGFFAGTNLPDYVCALCRAQNIMLHKAIKEYKNIKIVHHNYPFDKICYSFYYAIAFIPFIPFILILKYIYLSLLISIVNTIIRSITFKRLQINVILFIIWIIQK